MADDSSEHEARVARVNARLVVIGHDNPFVPTPLGVQADTDAIEAALHRMSIMGGAAARSGEALANARRYGVSLRRDSPPARVPGDDVAASTSPGPRPASLRRATK